MKKNILALLFAALSAAHSLGQEEQKEHNTAPESQAAALEAKVEDEAKEQGKARLPNFEGYDDERYHFYDAQIIQTVDFFNGNFAKLKIEGFQPLDPLLIKSMLIQESGSPIDTDAFEHDPLQIANEICPALAMLQGKTDGYTIYDRLGIADMSEYFKRYGHTPMRNGKPVYSPESRRIFMTGKNSIFGGIAFLYYKAFAYAEIIVEDSGAYDYIVKEGDTLGKIARRRHTTVEKLLEYNPELENDPSKIYPERKLIVVESHRKISIIGFLGWETAVMRYGPSYMPGYQPKIYGRLTQALPD